jgi:hypothetical protein
LAGAEHEPDPLVPTEDEWDVGSYGYDRNQPMVVDLEDQGVTLQEAFNWWTEQTAVADLGGAPYACGSGFPCPPWRSTSFEVLVDQVEPDPRNFPGLHLDCNPTEWYPDLICPSRPFTRLTVGKAQLQWFWVVARLDAEPPGGWPDATAGIQIVVEDPIHGVLWTGDFLLASGSDGPYLGASVTGRCRQRFPSYDLTISIRRQDSRTLQFDLSSDTEVGVAGHVEVVALGRLGHVIL